MTVIAGRIGSAARGLWVGQIMLRRGLLSGLAALAHREGHASLDLVPFSLFGRQAYLALDPRDIGIVLHDVASFRRAELFLRPFRGMLGFNAVTVAPDEWQVVRQRTLRFLSGRNLEGYRETMIRVLEEHTIPKWRQRSRVGQSIDVFSDMLEYASIVVFSAFLGIPHDAVPAHLHGTLSQMFDHVRRRVFAFVNVPMWIPTRENRGFDVLRHEIYDFVEARIARSRGTGSMLEALVDVHTREGALDRRRLLEEMLGNLIGGSETTIILLLWALYYLAHDPALQDRLCEEVTWAPNDLRNPRGLLNRCITETLRVRSPSYVAVREAIRPVQVRGVDVPAGAHVFASQFITHNDPRVWPQPDRFYPDRFVDRLPRTTIDRTDFFPFGGGQNVCTGQAYAFQEAAIALRMLVRDFRFKPVGPFDASVQAELTLRPAGSITIRVEERIDPSRTSTEQRASADASRWRST